MKILPLILIFCAVLADAAFAGSASDGMQNNKEKSVHVSHRAEPYGAAMQISSRREMAPGFTDSHPALAPWIKFLSGKKLTQIDSYYSSGGLGSGGYSSRQEINLCSDKTFTGIQSSSSSVDAGGSWGSGAGSNTHSGQWTMVTNGQVIGLILFGDNGGRSELLVEFKSGNIYLNDIKTFATNDAKCF